MRPEDCRVCGVGKHTDSTGIVGVAVAPILEGVVAGGCGLDGYLLTSVVGAGAGNGAARVVIAVDSDGVAGFGMELRGDVAVACDGQDAGVLSVTVAPAHKVMVVGRSGGEGCLAFEIV